MSGDKKAEDLTGYKNFYLQLFKSIYILILIISLDTKLKRSGYDD